MPAPLIVHMNCGTHGPRGSRLITGDGGWLSASRLVCHVLLVQLADGLALVDTGFGTADIQHRGGRAALAYNALVSTPTDLRETAVMQLRDVGIDPREVRHILLTHLDIDHTGGLPDFPHAQVHVSARELETARNPPIRERARYVTAAAHWAHHPNWVSHEPTGESWLGFQSVQPIPGSDDDVLLIPLPGHTLGHAGFAIRREEGWLLHCGDAFYHRDELTHPSGGPIGARVMETLLQADGTARHHNLSRLRELFRHHPEDVTLICAHDPVMFAQTARR